jgi:hypothetical protein
MERTNSFLQIRIKDSALLFPGNVDISTPVAKSSLDRRHNLLEAEAATYETLLITAFLDVACIARSGTRIAS